MGKLSRIERVDHSSSMDYIINPATTSGYILAADDQWGSLPIRVSVVVEGGWQALLEARGDRLATPALYALSQFMPEAMQQAEWLLKGGIESSLVPVFARLPSWALAPIVFLSDVLLATYIIISSAANAVVSPAVSAWAADKCL
mmetsp:Transcript_45391/g.75188  ORF Transcript_45391/g.75188 Transcript_45391/m.75188 type:complete len:144 (+) Transcript_45391:501-932(+)